MFNIPKLKNNNSLTVVLDFINEVETIPSPQQRSFRNKY